MHILFYYINHILLCYIYDTSSILFYLSYPMLLHEWCIFFSIISIISYSAISIFSSIICYMNDFYYMLYEWHIFYSAISMTHILFYSIYHLLCYYKNDTSSIQLYESNPTLLYKWYYAILFDMISYCNVMRGITSWSVQQHTTATHPGTHHSHIRRHACMDASYRARMHARVCARAPTRWRADRTRITWHIL